MSESIPGSFVINMERLLILLCVFLFLLSSSSAHASLNFSLAADGTPVDLTAQLVTAAWPGLFYIQQSDRACGIKVVSPQGVRAGDVVNIQGSLATVGGERQITASVVTVVESGNALPEALGIPIGRIGGSSQGFTPGVSGAVGLYNAGLYIKTAGVAADVGTNEFMLQHGGDTIKVKPQDLILPRAGDVVVIKGIGSIDNSSGVSQPKIRASSISTRSKWFPNHILFCGDSFTGGMGASGSEKYYINRFLAKLRAQYPDRAIEYRIITGSYGNPMRTLYQSIAAYSDPGWVDCVVLQDAQALANFYTSYPGDATANVVTNWQGGVSSVTITNPGSGYSEGDWVYLEQGNNLSAAGRVHVTTDGQVTGVYFEDYVLPYGGFGYTSGPVNIKPNSWLNLAIRCADDVKARYGQPGRVVPIFLSNGWLEWVSVFYNNRYQTWNDALDWWFRNSSYRKDVIGFDVYSISRTPGMRGYSTTDWLNTQGYQSKASCDGGTVWTLTSSLGFDPVAWNMYFTDGSFHSLITGYDGALTLTVADPRGSPRTAVDFLISQRTSGANYGDSYHPTDAGHEAIAESLFQAVKAEIEAAK